MATAPKELNDKDHTIIRAALLLYVKTAKRHENTADHPAVKAMHRDIAAQAQQTLDKF